jgi:hypothetical protein
MKRRKAWSPRQWVLKHWRAILGGTALLIVVTGYYAHRYFALRELTTMSEALSLGGFTLNVNFNPGVSPGTIVRLVPTERGLTDDSSIASLISGKKCFPTLPEHVGPVPLADTTTTASGQLSLDILRMAASPAQTPISSSFAVKRRVEYKNARLHAVDLADLQFENDCRATLASLIDQGADPSHLRIVVATVIAEGIKIVLTSETADTSGAVQLAQRLAGENGSVGRAPHVQAVQGRTVAVDMQEPSVIAYRLRPLELRWSKQ